jgi:hypothetical protein
LLSPSTYGQIRRTPGRAVVQLVRHRGRAESHVSLCTRGVGVHIHMLQGTGEPKPLRLLCVSSDQKSRRED